MALYRWLLHLCPAALREEYGDEMAATFARQLHGRRGLARVVALLAGLADVVTTAARAHADMAGQDVRDALRTCRRNRGYAAAVVAVSALGVGAATAAFSLADHVLVRPLPFAEPDRLVKLWQDQSFKRLLADGAVARQLRGLAAPELVVRVDGRVHRPTRSTP